MNSNANDSNQMQIGKVPAYVLGKHGLKITRRTVYNWIEKGVRGCQLATRIIPDLKKRGGQVHVTTPADVDQFFADIGA